MSTFLNRRSFLVKTAVASSVFACPAVVARAQSKTSITVSHGIPNFPDLISALTKGFAEKHPDIRLELIAGGDNWNPLLQSTLRDAVANNLPDATWQNLTYANILASRNIIVPLDDLFGDIHVLEEMGLSRPMIESTKIDGKVFGIPFGTTIPALFWNMNLLRKAGYQNGTPPEEWEEIFEIGTKVAELGSGINGGFVEYDSTNAWIFQNLLASRGGRMVNGREIAFNSPEGLEALETLSRFGDINNIRMSKSQARQAFDAGVTGVQFRSASGTASVSKAVNGSFDLQVGRFPMSSANGQLVGAGHGFFMFTRNPARQKAVWAFMKYISGPEGQLILSQNSGYMPINLLALQDRRFRDEYLKVNPLHGGIIDGLSITSDQYSFPSDNTVKIFDMMIEECRQVVEHSKMPESALRTMAKETEKLL